MKPAIVLLQEADARRPQLLAN